MCKVFFLFLITIVCLYGCDSKNKDKDFRSLIIGTNSEFPPFSYKKDGEIVGFDIDIAKEVCSRLFKTAIFKDMPFDALIPDLTMGNIDVIAAGMSATKERAKRVSFTKPYLTNDPLIILSTSNEVLNLNNLKDKLVVVNEGYTADLYLSNKPDFNLIRLSCPADAFLALTSNRCDAFITSESSIKPFVANEKFSEFHYYYIEEAIDNCAMVISKENEKLLLDVQTVLDAMEKDGTLNQIKNRWGL